MSGLAFLLATMQWILQEKAKPMLLYIKGNVMTINLEAIHFQIRENNKAKLHDLVQKKYTQ